MKRKFIIPIVVFMVSSINIHAYGNNNLSNLANDLAKSTKKVIVDKKDIKTVNTLVFFNGNEQRFSNSIKNYNGTTYLPFRELASLLGVKAEWIPTKANLPINGVAKFSNDDITVEILNQTSTSIVTNNEGSKKVIIKNNGKTIPALNVDGVTYVPIRYISDVFGMKIEYTQNHKSTNKPTIEIYNTSEKPPINNKEIQSSDTPFDKEFDDEFYLKLSSRDKENDEISNYGMSYVRDEKTGKIGFADLNGKLVVEPKFDMVDGFSEGLCAVYDKKIDKWGFVDKTGKLVIPYKFFGIGRSGFDIGPPIFSDGLAAVYDEETGKYGYIDKTGKLVIPYKFDMVGHFKEGRAKVKDFEYYQYGYIDKTGKLVIPYQFDEASNFIDGLARVSNGDRATAIWYVGYIDKTGKEVIPFKRFY